MGAGVNPKLIDLVRHKIEEDYTLTDDDVRAGTRNLYYFSNRAKGRINIFDHMGKKLVEIFPFCLCRCIYKHDGSWYFTIKYEIFLTNTYSFNLFPYMAKPQIMITITNLDASPKVIRDMRGKEIHTLTGVDEDFTLFNNGPDDQTLEWVITRKLQSICENYDDTVDNEKINEIYERTSGQLFNKDEENETEEVAKNSTSF